MLTGDFNGDGQVDAAVRLRGASGEQRIAVAFSRTDHYDVEEVTRDVPPGAVELGRQARGARYTHRDTGLADYFQTDTVTLAVCGQTPTGYLWTGSGFRPAPNMLIGAGPAVPPPVAPQ